MCIIFRICINRLLMFKETVAFNVSKLFLIDIHYLTSIVFFLNVIIKVSFLKNKMYIYI
jgi:hypothetical protein